MNTIRDTAAAFGLIPLLLIGLGFFRVTKHAHAFLVVGVIWGLANVLYAKREINATVTAGDATITYPGGGL